MKICPTCGNSFSDELSYCLQDGTLLSERITSDIPDRPTEIYVPTLRQTDISTAETIASHGGQTALPPQQQTGKAYRISAVEPKSKMGCAVSVGAVSGVLGVVIALGVVGLIFRGRNETAKLEQKPAANAMASNSSGNYSTSANALPAPAATTTPPVLSSETPPANTSVKTISGGVLNAKATSLPKPPYPAAARAVRASGSVSVQVLVSETGEVLSASAVSGHSLLRSAAENAARQARFSPTLLAGKPVRVSGVITYDFVLDDPAKK